MTFARALRWLAIAIALAAVIDPSVASRRRADSVISVLHGQNRQDSVLAERVARELDARFTVIRAPFPAASATVLAGTTLPHGAHASGGPAFAVLPDATTALVAIRTVHAPAQIPLHARARIDVIIEASGTDSVDISLLHGDMVLDRAALAMRDRARRHVTLSYVPTRAGSAALRVHAAARGTGQAASADALAQVHTAPWPVLFYDARPSWMSTFVRRALEHDPRFSVTSRTVTARELATEFGRPPRTLAETGALEAFGVVVVGAPEALTAADVASLEHYMRTRGAGVLLLLDRHAGGAWETLTHVQQWQFAAGSPQQLAAGTTGLRASELAWPAALPPLARPVAMRPAPRAPAVWSMPVGAGTLVVSGALDSWRFRDPGVAAFDAFWTSLIAGLADASPAAVSMTIAPAVARPGEWLDVTVTSRDAALASSADARAVRLVAEASVDSVPVRLWPMPMPGELRGRVRAPLVAGEYTADARVGDATSSVPLLVSADASHAMADERDLMRAWAISGAGEAVSAGGLEELADAIDARLGGSVRKERWHPMRSAWWILPFVLALGAEWLIRRRRGLL